MTLTRMEVDRLRAETPGCAERIHLNNAGSALMPEPVIRALQDHIALESRVGGYEAHDLRRDAADGAYRALATLLSTEPRNVAITDSATTSFLQALSSIPFERGDVLLTTRNDYISNQIQFLSLQRRFGIEIVRAPDTPEGGVDAAAMTDLIRTRQPRLVCVTHVPTNSGLVQDVAGVGEACRAHGVLYLVDACQSVGQMPIDVQRIGCDFLSATARKFLRGPRGAGFLYVSDRVLESPLEPLFLDMRGAEWTGADSYRPVPDARRFESWEFAWALVLATGEAARYATEIGLDAIRDRARSLAQRLRETLPTSEGVRVLDRGSERCAIDTIAIAGRDPAEIMRALRERRINTTAQIREHALLDFDDKGVAASLRLSPHYYNTEEEIDLAVAALRELVGASRAG